MAKFKPQFRRLQFIHGEIKKGGYPNCSTLADRWETSAKTIQRDIDYLRYEQKAPIEYDATKHGFYYTDKTYDLPAIRVSEGDLFALAIAEKALAQYRNTPLYDRLLNIFAKIQETLPEKVSVHPAWVDGKFSFADVPTARLDPKVWEAAAQGLRLRRLLRIEYQSPWHKKSVPRDLEPYHMMSFKGEWYLIGFDRYRKQVLTYALSRIRSAELLAEECPAADDFDLDAYMGPHFGVFAGERERRVAIWFSPDCAPYIRERDWHPSQKIREGKDGSLVLSFRLSHLLEIRRWILSWGGNAKALTPRELREDVRRELREATLRYVNPKPRARFRKGT
jgi:proteasome accessory factor B